jgi:hypothetical protein
MGPWDTLSLIHFTLSQDVNESKQLLTTYHVTPFVVMF